jgi:hypothetical protein
MRLFSPVCGALLALVSASSLHAAVVEHDWKVPGDGLLTYDTVNKREWLDLSQTLLSEQFPGTGSDFLEIRESRYQYVVAQTALGGLFEGFRVARSPQVLGLAQSAGIDTSSFSFPNTAPSLELGNLLGFTLQPMGGNKFAIGLMDELDSTASFLRRRDAQVVILGGGAGLAGLRTGIGHTDLQTPPGVMLYRAIPEPNTLILLIGALIYFQLFFRSSI